MLPNRVLPKCGRFVAKIRCCENWVLPKAVRACTLCLLNRKLTKRFFQNNLQRKWLFSSGIWERNRNYGKWNSLSHHYWMPSCEDNFNTGRSNACNNIVKRNTRNQYHVYLVSSRVLHFLHQRIARIGDTPLIATFGVLSSA